MLIIGAKGFAKEILEVLHDQEKIIDLAFFDDVSVGLQQPIMGRFPLLRTEDEVKSHFQQYGEEFILGLGNPELRRKMSHTMRSWGGKLTGAVSPKAEIGHYDVHIGEGCTILPLSVVANGSRLGEGCIVYYNTLVTHDCIVGDYAELSPGAVLLGGCEVGANSHIGSNATILPRVKVGSNVIVGAGAVVTKDIPDNYIVAGVPATKIN